MLLAIDTSTRYIGVALYDGAQVLSASSWLSKNHHTTELAPAIASALTRIGAEPSDLQVVGVASGPGSFTGLRIGLAVAKGLAASLHIPIIGIPTFDILAAVQPVQGEQLAAVIEAGRRRLAIGWYRAENDAWQASPKLDNLLPDEFVKAIRKPTVVCGELNDHLRQRLRRKHKNVILASPATSLRNPAYLAELAWERFQADDTDDAAVLKPIYLHHGEPIPG
jgi:tRNA threonylcarbamoyladenosine biosynthesis protein TsaB